MPQGEWGREWVGTGFRGTVFNVQQMLTCGLSRKGLNDRLPYGEVQIGVTPG